jgi:hypothetical protein
MQIAAWRQQASLNVPLPGHRHRPIAPRVLSNFNISGAPALPSGHASMIPSGVSMPTTAAPSYEAPKPDVAGSREGQAATVQPTVLQPPEFRGSLQTWHATKGWEEVAHVFSPAWPAHVPQPRCRPCAAKAQKIDSVELVSRSSYR